MQAFPKAQAALCSVSPHSIHPHWQEATYQQQVPSGLLQYPALGVLELSHSVVRIS